MEGDAVDEVKYLVDPTELIRRHRRRRPKKPRQQRSPLYAVVMSSHVRGLECWHALIRTELVPLHSQCLLHVDSHPDMMLPRAALTSSNPKELYVTLEASLGGIAEWLLPALYLGHCSRVVWLRARWCDQIRDGVHEFFIGKDPKDNTLHVTCTEPYFADEPGMLRSLEDLEGPIKVTLLVSDASQHGTIKAFMEGADSWLLDVCLDYFAVSNPFYDHAARLFGRDTAEALRDGFLQAKFRAELEMDRTLRTGGCRSAQEQGQKEDFEKAVTLLFTQDDAQVETGLKSHFSDTMVADGFISALGTVRRAGEEGFRVAVELLESPGLPHHPDLDLPNQKQLFDLFLQLSPPSACMVARSDEDEYTPSVECFRLESDLVEAMERAWPAMSVEAIEMDVEE